MLLSAQSQSGVYLGVPAILSTPDTLDLHLHPGSRTKKPISCGTQAGMPTAAPTAAPIAISPTSFQPRAPETPPLMPLTVPPTPARRHIRAPTAHLACFGCGLATRLSRPFTGRAFCGDRWLRLSRLLRPRHWLVVLLHEVTRTRTSYSALVARSMSCPFPASPPSPRLVR